MALSLANGLHFAITASDKTAGAFGQVHGNLSKTERMLTAVKGAIGLAFGAAAIGGIARMIDRTLDLQDQMGKLATRLGVSTEALSELRHVAQLGGVEFNALTMGLQRMQRRVAEAAQGTGEAKNALIELGLSARSLTSMSLDRQFEVVADALAGVGDAGDRTRLAMKLFDSEGVALLQTMQNGARGIREYREEARQLGRSMGEDQVRQAEAAKDAMTRLDAASEGLAIRVTNLLVPAFSELVEVLRDQVPPALQGVEEDLTGLSGFALETLLENIRSFTDFVPEFLLPEGWTEQLNLFEQGLAEAKIGLEAFGGSIPSYAQSAAAAAEETRNLRREIEDMSRMATPPKPKRRPDGTSIGKDQLDEHLDAYRDYRKQLEGEAEAVQRMIETPIETYNRQIEKLKELEAQGVISHEEMRRAAEKYQEEMEKAQDGIDKVGAAIEDSLIDGVDEVSRMLLGNRTSWQDWALFAVSKIGDVVDAAGGLGEIFGGGQGRAGGGGAGIVAGEWDWLWDMLPGFAHGGEFRVGGSGGTDSQMVAFRASPDETVSVMRPGQGGGGSRVSIAISVDARGASDPKAVEEAGRRGAMSAAPQIVQAAVNAVAEKHRREPRYLDPSRRG